MASQNREPKSHTLRPLWLWSAAPETELTLLTDGYVVKYPPNTAVQTILQSNRIAGLPSPYRDTDRTHVPQYPKKNSWSSHSPCVTAGGGGGRGGDDAACFGGGGGGGRGGAGVCASGTEKSDADGCGGGGGGSGLLPPSDREDMLGAGGGGGGGRGFPAAPIPSVIEDPRPACESNGGGAPGLARDTSGGGAPTAPPAGRACFADRRLFITTGSRAGGGGAMAGTGSGATAFRAAAARSKRSFLLELSRPPAAAADRGEAAGEAEEPPGFKDLGDPPPPPTDGEGRSDIPPTLDEDGLLLCSPHMSAVSATLPMSPNPAAALPGSVTESEARDSDDGGSSA